MKRSKEIYYNPENPDEDWVYDLYKHWKSNLNPIPSNELLHVFPQAKSIVKNQLKELHQRILYFNKLENQIKDICFRKIPNILERDRTEDFFIELEVNLPRQETEKDIKELENILRWASDDNKSKITLDIPKAKSYPISQLIEFKGNTAKCIWHSPDKNPSMHYYQKNNKVHCFSCGKSGDSIDVVMQIRGCNLSEAVKFINQSV